MTDSDETKRAQCGRYREMANAILALVPAMKHSGIAEDLRQLAAGYEKLAEFVETAPNPAQEELQESRP